MRRTFLVVVVMLAVTSSVRGAAVPAPLLALMDGGLGDSSRLVALEPRTLEPRRGRSLTLPGWAFGREWARSPDGAQLALVPKPSQASERLFVIGTRGSLRILARLPLPGEDVCRLAWPSARRLIIVLTRGDGCYGAVESARVLVVDPLRTRVVARRPLSGPVSFVVTTPTRHGLALLLASPGRRSGAHLVLVAAGGTRSIPLPPLKSVPRPLDKSVAGGAVGLAVDAESRRAYLVESQARIIEVDLASGNVRIHALPLRRPAAAAKRRTESVVQALALRGELLAVTGVIRQPRGALLPVGLRLVDTRTWRSRLVDPAATGIAHAGTTILAFQPFFDQLGGRVGAIGLRGYTFTGSLRFKAHDGRPIGAALIQGSYAYAAVGPPPGGTSVIDLDAGRVEAPDPDAVSISPIELLAS
jgi:hypothetical protein